jgi:predicted esterase
MKSILVLAATCLWPAFACQETRAEGSETNLTSLARSDARFTQRAPYSDEAGITKHLGYTVPLPEYAITNELFELRVPENVGTNESWGLLVWISPSDHPTIPSGWDLELAKRHLLFVSAHRSGNSRHPLDRFRLALDATCNMCRRCTVDRRRIYVGGFSGGARMASMLGVAYADIFTGTLCVCGVNFYKDVAAAGGQYYPATFTPDPGVLVLGKRNGRFVLLTGEHDENRNNTERLAAKGFRSEGFRNVLYLEVPGLGHEMPSSAVIGQALDYLMAVPEKTAIADSPQIQGDRR